MLLHNFYMGSSPELTRLPFLVMQIDWFGIAPVWQYNVSALTIIFIRLFCCWSTNLRFNLLYDDDWLFRVHLLSSIDLLYRFWHLYWLNRAVIFLYIGFWRQYSILVTSGQPCRYWFLIVGSIGQLLLVHLLYYYFVRTLLLVILRFARRSRLLW